MKFSLKARLCDFHTSGDSLGLPRWHHRSLFRCKYIRRDPGILIWVYQLSIPMKRLRDYWAKYGDDWSYWGLKALNHQPPTGPFSYFLGTLRSFLSVGYPGGGMKAQRGPAVFTLNSLMSTTIDTTFRQITYSMGVLLHWSGDGPCIRTLKRMKILLLFDICY